MRTFKIAIYITSVLISCLFYKTAAFSGEAFAGKNPFIMIDSKDSAIILFGRDTNGDGEEDAMYFMKFDKNGKRQTQEKVVISSPMLMEPICLMDSSDFIHVIWFQPEKNYGSERKFNPGFHPLVGSIYYKKIDNTGKPVKSEKISGDILESYCRKDIPLRCYLDYPVDEVKKIAVDLPSGTKKTFRDLIAETKHVYNAIDSKGNKHEFFVKSNSCLDKSEVSLSCYGAPAVLCYSKLDKDGKVLIKGKQVARHDKLLISQHGPDIISMRTKIDSNDNVHIVWYINDGTNNFRCFYKKLNNEGEEIKLK